jgi:hypothetical protein
MAESTAPTGVGTRTAAWPQIVFTIAEARRALVYLQQVVKDAATAYHEAQDCRAELAVASDRADRLLLSHRRDRALARLSGAADECNAVGADLLDISRGVVRFPAQVDGRAVSLLWRLGEPIHRAWADLGE